MNLVFRIRPWAGGWGVFRDEENVAVEPYRTPADAVIHAKELARHTEDGAQICVYNESGTLLSELFYQRDERSALDRDDTIPSLAASRPARRGPGRPGSGMP
jgi:hypothetical protein